MAVDAAARPGFWRSLLLAFSAVLEARKEIPWSPASLRDAAKRSRRLLMARLTPEQRAEFESAQCFTVEGASGRLYRVVFGTAINIEVLGEQGAVLYRLCAGPEHLPACSVMLAQKVMLETREEDFLRIAIRHPPSAGIVPTA